MLLKTVLKGKIVLKNSIQWRIELSGEMVGNEGFEPSTPCL